MIEIPYGSPLYRLYEATYDHNGGWMTFLLGSSKDDVPPYRTNLCQFFWRIVLTVLWAQLANVAYILMAFTMLLGLRRLLLTAAQLASLDGAVPFILFGVAAIGVTIGGFVAVGVVLGAYSAARAYVGVKSAQPARTRLGRDLALTWQFLKAVKGRFCPIVRFGPEE